MVWRRPLLSACTLVGIVASTGVPAAACFPDLPQPIACPPLEVLPMGDCSGPLNDAPVILPPSSPPFCVTDTGVHACLLGPRESCACGPDECPEPTPSCFADDECPAAVKAIAPDARCLRPSADSFATLASEGCICGCMACARICDGKGPSIGIKFPDGAGDPPAPLAVRLPPLPRGRLGIYVRIRGIANLALVAGKTKAPAPMLQQPLQVGSQAHFIELTFGPTEAWTDPSEAPEIVALLAQPGATEAEVDCIIPYVMP